MANDKRQTRRDVTGRRPKKDPAVYRYGIKLNAEENGQFELRFAKSGLMQTRKYQACPHAPDSAMAVGEVDNGQHTDGNGAARREEDGIVGGQGANVVNDPGQRQHHGSLDQGQEIFFVIRFHENHLQNKNSTARKISAWSPRVGCEW